MMRKERLTAQTYSLLVDLWMERMLNLAEQIEDRAEHYPSGSRNHLELISKAAGIRASIEQLTTLEDQFINVNRGNCQVEA